MKKSEATFCESVRQRGMEQSITQQILSKIEDMEKSIDNILDILNQSKNEK